MIRPFLTSLRRPLAPGVCASALAGVAAAGIALLLLAAAPAFAQIAQTGSAQSNAAQTGPAQTGPAQTQAPAPAPRHGKEPYTGPTAVVSLPATPVLDEEGKQRVDPDGKPMWNPPVKQMRDKKGHPAFDADGKPIFQTPTNLGYDERGKKIPVKKVKPPKTMPMEIVSGTLTVDGWTGKARLNYDIADVKFLYIYAPAVGIAVISPNAFAGATEQTAAFNDRTLHISVDGHPIELYSEKRLLSKRPEAAWVMVDRKFALPARFPVFGYGATTRPPYAWPGSKETAVNAPPLPADVQPTLLLAPCPAGMMRRAGPPALPGQRAQTSPCVPLGQADSATPVSTSTPSPTR